MTHSAIAAGDRYGTGIAYQFFAVLVFTCMTSLIKVLGAEYATAQIVFFRSLPALIPLLLYLPSQGGFAALRTRRPGLQALRAITGLGSMACGFYAIAAMTLADYVAISFTAPLFGTLLSIPFLGERVGPWRFGACLVGFSGIVIMVGPTGAGLDLYAGFAVASAFLYGVVMIAMRRLGGVDNAAATVFYFTFGSALASGAAMVFDWVTPTFGDLLLLCTVGILGGIGQICMTQAYRLAPPSIIAPFDYTAMIWALLIGWFFFDTLPTASSAVGAAVICASGLFILYREAIRGVRKTPVKRTSI
jgi:drug/metabolite transporter (DMT)-like permease